MKSTTLMAAALCAVLATPLSHAAATKDEAVAMVKSGIAFLKANGTEKGYTEISNKEGQFRKDDLYLVVYGLDGKCLAHGSNAKQIGKDLIDLTDIDGKYFVKERVALAKANPGGFVEIENCQGETARFEVAGGSLTGFATGSPGDVAEAVDRFLRQG